MDERKDLRSDLAVRPSCTVMLTRIVGCENSERIDPLARAHRKNKTAATSHRAMKARSSEFAAALPRKQA